MVSFEQIVDGVEGDQGPAEQKLEGRAVSNDFGSPVRFGDDGQGFGVESNGPLGTPEAGEQVGGAPHRHRGTLGVGDGFGHGHRVDVLGGERVAGLGGHAGHQGPGRGASTSAKGAVRELASEGQIAGGAASWAAARNKLGSWRGVVEPPRCDAHHVPRRRLPGRQGIGQRSSGCDGLASSGSGLAPPSP